jgi:hypothetical protein
MTGISGSERQRGTTGPGGGDDARAVLMTGRAVVMVLVGLS